MAEAEKLYDTIHMGRSCIDLYSNQSGVPFHDIKTFSAYVGGSPTNICVGAARLGLKTALLTAVGQDPVGDFILAFLQRENIETKFIPRKSGRRSSAVLLGIQPPDKFPLVYYRENCADSALNIDDVLSTPISRAGIFQFGGTNLSVEPCRSATLFAAEQARAAGVEVVLDIDFRSDQWKDPRDCGIAMRSALALVDTVIGTEDEINVAMLTDPSQVATTNSVSHTTVGGDVDRAVAAMLSMGPAAIIRKQGRKGALIHQTDGHRRIETTEAPGYQVEVVNVLGAGDAFAAGLLYGRIKNWTWYKSVRFANACGAIIVTRHGCANFMPTCREVTDFIEKHGGID
jgi:5-dehydro-2-deoxygluconokinase